MVIGGGHIGNSRSECKPAQWHSVRMLSRRNLIEVAAAIPLIVLKDKEGMPITPVDPHGTAFAHATHLTGITQWLFVSGQVGTDDNYENPPPTFKEQARLAWKNVERRLSAGGMGLTDIAKVTIYLADRKYRGDNFDVRCEVLGTHRPAVTIIAADIYDEAWLLEVEVIAAK